jgi:hypothetical protein
LGPKLFYHYESSFQKKKSPNIIGVQALLGPDPEIAISSVHTNPLAVFPAYEILHTGDNNQQAKNERERQIRSRHS